MSPKSHKHMHYNVALVDKLWNLKRLCEVQLKMHIPLNMVLKDEEYRAELLEKALSAGDEELTKLVWDVRQMEDSIVTATHTGDEFKPKKKTRGTIRLNFISAAACSLLLLLSGYLFRSFLPLDAGEVFVLQAITETRVQSAVKPQQQAYVPGAPVIRSNTVGEKLTPRLVESYFMARGATDIKTEQGNAPTEKAVSAQLNGRIEFIEIHAHGSSTAFTDLLQGSAELGMSSRRIKEQERELLLGKSGDLTEAGSEHIIGLDGLAIIANTKNPLTQL